MKHIRASFLAVFIACSSFVNGHESFSYSEHNGPSHWPGICTTGREQSPIDLTNQYLHNGNTRANWVHPSITFNHLTFGMNHWALTFNLTSSNNYELGVAAHPYQLSGFHFHTPSEHSINGQHGNLELHFVHKNLQGNIAVVGVLFKVSPNSGNTDSFFKQFITTMPHQNQDERPRKLNSLSLQYTFSTLFSGRPFYRYEGSLTTPPCTEHVIWTVHSEMLPVNPRFFNAMKQLLGNNARPIQRRILGMANAGNNNIPPVTNKEFGNNNVFGNNNGFGNPNIKAKLIGNYK